jgi:putative hydrolase of the HAD superfamily
MASAPLRIIFFDLDDTIYPEREYVLSGFRAIANWAESRWGLTCAVTLAEFQSYFASGYRQDVFQRWLAEKNLPAAALQEMVQVMCTHTPGISLRIEAKVLLDCLQQASYTLGLVTEGRRKVQEAKINALGLDRWLSAKVIMGEEETAHWKPSAVPFERALALLSGDPKQAVYIGDNPRKDFRGARTLGIRTVRVRYADGLHFGEEPATSEDAPDCELENLTGVSELVRHWPEASE